VTDANRCVDEEPGSTTGGFGAAHPAARRHAALFSIL
jgi:hypothetical protein